jgi:hypothetical protein
MFLGFIAPTDVTFIPAENQALPSAGSSRMAVLGNTENDEPIAKSPA